MYFLFTLYIPGSDAIPFMTASVFFYCISRDGWRATDTEIYRPSACSGRALEGSADI